MFRNGREIGDVGEPDGKLTGLAAQGWQLTPGHHSVEDGSRKIEGKRLPDVTLVPVRDREAVSQKGGGGDRGADQGSQQRHHLGVGEQPDRDTGPHRGADDQCQAGKSKWRRHRYRRHGGGDSEHEQGHGAPIEFFQRVAAQQVVDGVCMDVDGRDRVSPKSVDIEIRHHRIDTSFGQTLPFRRRDESFRRDLTVLDVEHRADNHNLAREMAPKIIDVALLRAGVQIGE